MSIGKLPGVVALLALAAGAWAGAAEAQGPAPVCSAGGVGDVAPRVVRSGEVVTVTIELAGTCPAGLGARADVFLLVDRSASMGEGGKLDAARVAVRLFVERVDFARHRAGMIAFNNTAYVLAGLTDRPDRLLRALGDVGAASQGTDIAEAIDLAQAELERHIRPGAVAVLVLLTDGQSDVSAMTAAAAASRRAGTVIFAIALGPDADQAALSRVATSPLHLAVAPAPEDLLGVYERIAGVIERFSVTDAVLTLTLGGGVSYVPGSGRPAEPAGKAVLGFGVPVLAADPLPVSFGARLRTVGRYPPATGGLLEYRDADGERRSVELPPLPAVEVRPRPRPAYLPLAVRRHCVGAFGGVDAVLAIDTSESMRGDKLRDAVTAAAEFVRLLDAPEDQAAVVSFAADARLEHGLTGNDAALEAALMGLDPRPGTRVDLGIGAATAELLGPGRRVANRPVVVVLSDGRQEEPWRVLETADLSRQLGVTIYTIALGEDADRALLAAAAGTSRRAFVAASPGNLAALYRDLTGLVRCR